MVMGQTIFFEIKCEMNRARENKPESRKKTTYLSIGQKVIHGKRLQSYITFWPIWIGGFLYFFWHVFVPSVHYRRNLEKKILTHDPGNMVKNRAPHVGTLIREFQF